MQKLAYFLISIKILTFLEITDVIAQNWFNGNTDDDFQEVVLPNIRLEGVRANALDQSNGIEGISFDFDLDYLNGYTNMLGKSYELFVYFVDPRGQRVKATNPNGVYSDRKGNLILTKSFTITKYLPVFDETKDPTKKIHDGDTGLTFEIPPKRYYALKTFLPYYAIKTNSRKDTITAHFWVKENSINILDSTKVVSYRYFGGIREHEMYLSKPSMLNLRISVDEIEAMSTDKRGQKWDMFDLQQEGTEPPDMQWMVSLQTKYKTDRIYTSEYASNTHFNKWHHTYSPLFQVCTNDPLTITVVDTDYLKNPDQIGSWRGTVSTIRQLALKNAEISFGRVKRLRFNLPHSSLQIKFGKLKLERHQSWDFHSLFYDIESPDIFIQVKNNLGEVLLKSEVKDNTFVAEWENMLIQFVPKTNDRLFVEVYDADLVQDDLIGILEVPIATLFEKIGDRYFLNKEGVGQLEVVVK